MSQKLTDYKNKKVLLTGHTGFKGSWMASWLKLLGADVLGYSIDIPTQPAHYELLNLDIQNIQADIVDLNKFKKTVEDFDPDIIFHMAAQPIVRASYDDPVETFSTNVMGTVNLFEAARTVKNNIKAIINITSDKCYENRELNYSYKETDPMGGYDPYSASKGCAELVASSFTRSFFNLEEYGQSHNCLTASVRAGNVIGGGDWADKRLLPDVFRSYAAKETLIIKNPVAVRPWQHVLEPVYGYMKLGLKLLNGEKEFSGPWNFGPQKESCIPVKSVLSVVAEHLPNFKYEIQQDKIHEANLLMLDSSKAMEKLGWQTSLTVEQAIEWTAKWYRFYYDENKVLTTPQLEQYLGIINER